MLNSTSISNTLVQAKFYSIDVMNTLLAMQKNGEDIEEIQFKFILLNKWIVILEDYYNANYGPNGNVTPTTVCLSEADILELVAKLKIMIGNNKYFLDDWILSTGYWRAEGIWTTTGIWIAGPPLS